MPQQEYRGRFNLPGEVREVAGTVLRDQQSGRVILELDDVLHPAALPFTLASYAVIQGTMIDGSVATLLHCTQIAAGSADTDERSAAEAYSCEFWVSGASIVGADELYSRVEFSLTDLVPWLGRGGFDVHSDLASVEPVYSVRTAPAQRFEANTQRGKVEFRGWAEFKAGPESAQVRTRANIHILPREPLSLEQVLRLLGRPLQDMLTIATGRPQDLSTLRMVPARLVPLGQAPRDHYDWCEVQFARWSNHDPNIESKSAHEMLFSLSDLDPSLSKSLDAWFNLDEQVHELRTLATGAVYRPGMFADQRFLYAAHALETYHRRRIGGRERPRAAHRELLREILSATPEQHRQWLRDKLAFANELTLLPRLTQLRERVCAAVEALLNSIESWEKWVRDTRNFNTHFTRKKNAKIASGANLLALAESLLLLLDDLVLLELGLSDIGRNNLIRGTRRYARVAHWFSDLDWSVS